MEYRSVAVSCATRFATGYLDHNQNLEAEQYETMTDRIEIVLGFMRGALRPRWL